MRRVGELTSPGSLCDLFPYAPNVAFIKINEFSKKETLEQEKREEENEENEEKEGKENQIPGSKQLHLSSRFSSLTHQ